MERGDLGIEKFFSQLKVSELPNGQKPKFKVGDLVVIKFTSGYSATSTYVLNDGMGIVAEVTIYECADYSVLDYCDRAPFYITEYRIISTDKKTAPRYVSEQHLELVEKQND